MSDLTFTFWQACECLGSAKFSGLRVALVLERFNFLASISLKGKSQHVSSI